MRGVPARLLLVALVFLGIGPVTPDVRAAGFVFTDFSSTAGLNLVASAGLSGSDIRISPASPNTIGSVWYTTKQDVVNGFQTNFTFRITSPSGITDATNAPGGDGFAFLVQNTASTAIGSVGYIGYDIANSVAVEFDTWQNPNFIDLEPGNNHVGVQSGGSGPNGFLDPNYVGSAAVIPDMSDGSVHTAMVRYVPGTLSIFVDDMADPVLTVPFDMNTLNLDSGTAYVGFTAGGSAAYENHDLLSWEFRTIPEPGALVLSLGCTLALALRRVC